jgi:hypothetical protein
VAITIPNGVSASVRRHLIELEVDGLAALNAQIVKQTKSLIPPNGSIDAYAHQRHFTSQSAPSTTDAHVSFRLETSLPEKGRGVKYQPEWTKLFASLIRRKRANIQFGYIAKLPWGTKGLDSRESLRLIAGIWCGMEPLLDVLRGKFVLKPNDK